MKDDCIGLGDLGGDRPYSRKEQVWVLFRSDDSMEKTDLPRCVLLYNLPKPAMDRESGTF